MTNQQDPGRPFGNGYANQGRQPQPNGQPEWNNAPYPEGGSHAYRPLNQPTQPATPGYRQPQYASTHTAQPQDQQFYRQPANGSVTPQSQALTPYQGHQQGHGYQMTGMPTQPKSKIAAAVLCFFFGHLGVHNFYLGQTASGIMKIVLELLGWLFVWIPFLGWAIAAVFWVPLGIWVVVEFIMILTGSGNFSRDRKGVPVV